MKQPSEQSGNDDLPLKYPFNDLGEWWPLEGEMFIRPNSTWVMNREPYRYDFGYHSYNETLPEDTRDLKFDDLIIVRHGKLVETKRTVNYGSAHRMFPGGKPIVREAPYDPYSHYHLLSCVSTYLIRIEAAVERHLFAPRTFDRTFSIKFEGRAMIDGNTRHVLRNEELLKTWTRDFRQVYGGDRA